MTAMTVVAWIVEGSWPAVVDATRTYAPAGAEIVLLHVTEASVPEVAHGAYAGLLGRGHRERDPGTRLEHLSAASATDLLQAAADRLGRDCDQQQRTGRPERAVVAAAEGAELLILARDGDQARLGPKSLGRASRFIVDHAPCAVFLVWPVPAPGVDTIPPPPPHHR
ncbi:MAG TPA: universal stress protein [Actinocrinis sp.]|nr:universal stress protein [Actinocrinis sp.]HEV3169098.1 universal stress protein [Actinocrinis sp.]